MRGVIVLQLAGCGFGAGCRSVHCGEKVQLLHVRRTIAHPKRSKRSAWGAAFLAKTRSKSADSR